MLDKKEQTIGKMQKDYVKEEYPYSGITSKIIAVAKEVHRILEPGDGDWIVVLSLR